MAYMECGSLLSLSTAMKAAASRRTPNELGAALQRETSARRPEAVRQGCRNPFAHPAGQEGWGILFGFAAS